MAGKRGTCQVCGKPARNPNAAICNNPECINTRRRNNERARLLRLRTGNQRECVVCGKAFTPDRQYYKVCGAVCQKARIDQLSAQQVREEREQFKKIPEPLTRCLCPKCGKHHTIPLRWIGRGEPRVYCQWCKNLKSVRFSRDCVSPVI